FRSQTTRPPPHSTLFPYTTLFRSLCPRDGHNILAFGEHPGQRELGRRHTFFASQFLDRCHQLEVFLQCLISETRICPPPVAGIRSEEHTSELQSRGHLVCRLLLEK